MIFSLIFKITIILKQRIIKIILQDKLDKNDRRFKFPNSLVPRQTKETQFFLEKQKAFLLETT